MNYQHLSTEERHQIAAMRGQYIRMVEIARQLGRHRSTIYREIWRNRSTHDGKYRATHSIGSASGRKRRSRRKMQFGREDFKPIEAMVREELSPEQIVGRRKLEGLRVMSHETIYKWIWADKRHGGSLWKHLRCSPKKKRKRYGRNDSRGRLGGKRMIETRPAIVEDRRRIGDWEIDTVHGRGKASVVTVVERKSGLVRIGKLNRVTKEQTTLRTLDLLWNERERVKTITADNGCEFHDYKKIEMLLQTDFYFATPHHAWERGTNENTNGLIRQYLPKGKNLRRVTQEQCGSIAEKLNTRPRKRLGFKTPNEVYYLRPFVALQS